MDQSNNDVKVTGLIFNQECISCENMNISSDIDVQCPYCGEENSLRVEAFQDEYSTIEDCTVCCRPIQFYVTFEDGEIMDVEVSPA